MAENINLLTNDSFRILQTRLAEQIGITQPTLSRVIKRMVYGGVLSVIKGYEINKFAKTYGIGPKVKGDIKIEMIGNAYDFWLPYEDGRSWDHFLEDVRQAVYKHVSLRGITEIINEKQNMRPSHKQRSLKEIENAYKSCLTYQQERRHLSA
jgi:DNA-binding Lrp family transcriptional regulator